MAKIDKFTTRHVRGRPVANKNAVPKKQWNRWSRQAQKVFNSLYHSMRPRMQYVYTHPAAKAMLRDHWETIRWNAAWMAADAVDEITLAGPVRK